MAAKNNDSNRIFNLYVNKFLTEQEGESENSNSTNVRDDIDRAIGSGVRSAVGTGLRAMPGISNVMQATDIARDVAPYVKPALNAAGRAVGAASRAGRAGVSRGLDSAERGGGILGGLTGYARGAAEQLGKEFQNQDSTQTQTATNQDSSSSTPSQTQSSWNLTSAPDTSLDTTRPGEAVAAGTAAQTGLGSVARTSAEQGGVQDRGSQVASRQPSAEEIKQYGQTGAVLRQNSGGQFTTQADRANQEKVDAVLGRGKYKAGTAEANLALANYFRNNPTTITPGRPGQPAGSTNFAQQAQQLGLSPETQQDLASSNQSTPTPTAQAQQQSMRPEDFITMGQQLGLSQSTIDALQRELNQSS